MHRITASALLGAGALLLTALPGPAHAAELTAPVYHVTQEGLSADQGAKLADTFGIPNLLQEDGGFTYTSDAFAKVPLRDVAKGKDESGRPTLSQAVDTRALAALKPLPESAALDRAAKLVDIAELSPGLTARPTVSHTTLTLSDRAGTPTSDA